MAHDHSRTPSEGLGLTFSKELPLLAFCDSDDRNNARVTALQREFLSTLDRSSSGRTKAEQRSWNRRLSAARCQLRNRGFAVIRGLLPDQLMYSIGRYYQNLASEGRMGFDDGQSVRYWAHNEQFACWLHCQMGSWTVRLISNPVKPSYSYVCLYVGGSDLPRHTDRPECEYTLSLAVSSTPPAIKPWPLYLDVPSRPKGFGARLNPGDGLIFRGREIPHYRKRLSNHCTWCSILFHFVPDDFSGSLD